MGPKSRSRSTLDAWFVHLYTAFGAMCAFMALTRVYYDRYQEAFIWLAAAVALDATDGMLARHMDVARRLPHFNGAKLDDIVDYLTYVFVPAFVAWHALLVPERCALPVAAAILLSSAYGFNRADAKTDHFFTGFPSYWNIVVFYLYVARWPEAVNAAVLLVLAVLVFVPIGYVYPSRTPTLQPVTLMLGVVWAAVMIGMLWMLPDIPAWLLSLSLVFPIYYVVLSLVLTARRRAVA